MVIELGLLDIMPWRRCRSA